MSVPNACFSPRQTLTPLVPTVTSSIFLFHLSQPNPLAQPLLLRRLTPLSKAPSPHPRMRIVSRMARTESLLTPLPPHPPQVITKITNIEKQLQSQADNFRHVLDQLHSLSQTQNTHSDRLLTIEDSSTWKDSKHKSCQSTKRVDSNTASLKKLSLEVATLSGQVNEISIDVRSPPIESVKLATQVADLTRQLSDMHNVMSAQIGDLTKQVTDIQATLYKRLTNPNTTVTLTPIVDTLPATSNTPPPSIPTDPFADEDVLNI